LIVSLTMHVLTGISIVLTVGALVLLGLVNRKGVANSRHLAVGAAVLLVVAAAVNLFVLFG